MPLPAYFVCSEGISVDKDANKITLFNICEQIPLILKEKIPAGHQVQPAPMRIVSSWMKEDSDSPETTFEHQLVFHLSGQQEELIVAETPFRFTAVARFHRIMTPPIFFPGFPGPGILKIESRVRKIGENEWSSRQFFYIELAIGEVTFTQPPT